MFSSLGKGMFANVVRARVLQGDATEVGTEVAIKIVRSQETMLVTLLSISRAAFDVVPQSAGIRLG